jgi:hypothetical protein
MISKWTHASVGDAARMLTALTALGDADAIKSFLLDCLVQTGGAVTGLPGALAILKSEDMAGVIGEFLQRHIVSEPGLCAAVLSAATGRGADLKFAAEVLLGGLPGAACLSGEDGSTSPRRPSIDAAFVMNVGRALSCIDPRLAERAVDTILRNQLHYPVDDVLIPAVLGLSDIDTAAARLRSACLNHLRERMDAPLAPPADWARNGSVGCSCAHCAELHRFLIDPGRETWQFRAAEHHRRHVQDIIRAAKADLDTRTEKRGSPHTLVATKNQASYERRVRQRQKDLENAARILALEGPR